jgi:hypothetical protein
MLSKFAFNSVLKLRPYMKDDGSHVPWHQIFTLEYLFEHLLKDGGGAVHYCPAMA